MKITDQYGVAGCVLLIEERFPASTHLRTPTFSSKATLEIGAPRMDRKSRLIVTPVLHQTRVPDAEHKRGQSRFGGFGYRVAGLGLEA